MTASVSTAGGTGANLSGIGTEAWTTPENVTADDATNAVVIFGGLGHRNSNYLTRSGMTFFPAIPSTAVIDGIEQTWKRRCVDVHTSDSEIRMLKAGAIVGGDRSADADWTDTYDYVTFGNPLDLWDTTWTPDDFNSGNVGGALACQSTTADETAEVDYCEITVYWTDQGCQNVSFGAQGTGNTDCCCDPCIHTKISCNPPSIFTDARFCCRCIPRQFCALFTPDEGQPETCVPVGFFIGGTGAPGVFEAAVAGLIDDPEDVNDDDNALLISITLLGGDIRGNRDPYNPCRWEVRIIDEETNTEIYFASHTIDGVYMTCTNPSFEIPLASEFCAGTILITRYDLEKVPFVRGEECVITAYWSWLKDCSKTFSWSCTPGGPSGGWSAIDDNPDCDCTPPVPTTPCIDEEQEETTSCSGHGTFGLGSAEWALQSVDDPDNCGCTPPEPTEPGTAISDTTTTVCDNSVTGFQCGDCKEVCRQLCVQYTLGDELLRRTFTWNESYQHWRDSDCEIHNTIYPYEDSYGNCYLLLDILDLADAGYDFEPIPLVPCSTGLDTEVTDTDNQITLSISCNPCSCWGTWCGNCRCACNELCVVIYGTEEVNVYNLPFVFENCSPRWTDGEISAHLLPDQSREGECPTPKPCIIRIEGYEDIEIGDDCGLQIQGQLFEEGDTEHRYFKGFVVCKTCFCDIFPPNECCPGYVQPLMVFATIGDLFHCLCSGATIPLYWNPFGGGTIGAAWIGCGSIGTCSHPSEICIAVKCSGEIFVTGGYCGEDGAGDPFLLSAGPADNTVVTSCEPVSSYGEWTIDVSCCDDTFDDPYDMIYGFPAPRRISITITE